MIINDVKSMALIEAGVRDAVWPWAIEGVRVLLDYDIDRDENRLSVDAFFKNVSTWYFTSVTWEMIDRPLDEISEVILVKMFTKAFRSWRAMEPEPNVILGEN